MAENEQSVLLGISELPDILEPFRLDGIITNFVMLLLKSSEQEANIDYFPLGNIADISGPIDTPTDADYDTAINVLVSKILNSKANNLLLYQAALAEVIDWSLGDPRGY